MALARFFKVTAFLLICLNLFLWRGAVFQNQIMQRLHQPLLIQCATNTYRRMVQLAMEYQLMDVRDDLCIGDVLDVATAVDISNNFSQGEFRASSVEFPARPRWIIVVQVHDRVSYLEELVKSLRQVRGISDALVVFSHDVHSAQINSIVEGIEFCRTVQLFYPLRLELFKGYPNGYAGNCSQGGKKSCTENDQLRPARVASLAQIKQHWWWKVVQVFEHIVPETKYDEWVLFLEEDNYVSPDLLEMLGKMSSEKQRLCETCEFLVLGNYNNLDQFLPLANVGVVPWYSSTHNLGLTFKKSLWMEIKKHAKTFCTYNDYNWDWTLNYISMHVLATRWKALVVKRPRVFHVGDCGVHKKGAVCTNTLTKVKRYLEGAPAESVSKIELSPLWPQYRRTAPPNGAWNDTRDHLLCLWNLHSCLKE